MRPTTPRAPLAPVVFTADPTDICSDYETKPWAINLVLFHEKANTNGQNESNFYAVPKDGGLYQIFWKNDDGPAGAVGSASLFRLIPTAP